MSENAGAIEALVRRYRELGSAIAELKGEQEEIKAQVDSLVEVGWKDTVDGIAVHKRAPNRSFDHVVAASLLSPDERAQCVVQRYDPAMLRVKVEQLGKLDECMISNPLAAAVVKI